MTCTIDNLSTCFTIILVSRALLNIPVSYVNVYCMLRHRSDATGEGDVFSLLGLLYLFFPVPYYLHYTCMTNHIVFCTLLLVCIGFILQKLIKTIVLKKKKSVRSVQEQCFAINKM